MSCSHYSANATNACTAPHQPRKAAPSRFIPPMSLLLRVRFVHCFIFCKKGVADPKCGTTWVTAILHALRTRGMDEFQRFNEITEVVPWDIVALDCGQDLDADQACKPRIFKSHEAWADIAKGGRYVYICRHPADALVSFYNFLPRYMHCEGISVEGFSKAVFGGLSHSGGIWGHFVGWIEAARKMPDTVLILTFEDLKRDLRREIERISRFFEPDLPAAKRADLVDKAHALSTYAYMSAHEQQFNDNFVFERLKAQIGLPADAAQKATKVLRGTVGSRTDLPHTVHDMLETRWRNTVLPRLGVGSYESLVQDIIHGELHEKPQLPVV